MPSPTTAPLPAGALYVPGLGEARERETRERLAAYLDPLWLFDSCAVRVVQLTPRIYLELAASPLTGAALGGKPNFAGIAAMLWRLQKDFRAGDEEQRNAIFHAVAHAKIKALRADLKDYLTTTFADQPGDPDGAQAGNPPPWSWLASLVDLFAAEYGWPRATVLDSPFRCLYQELRCIIRRRNPKALFINRHSDEVVQRFIRGEVAPAAPATEGRN